MKALNDYIRESLLDDEEELIGRSIEASELNIIEEWCREHKIYNGKFDGTFIEGKGVFASLLDKHGVKILSEEDADKREELLAFCKLILDVLKVHMDILAINVPEAM